jgi:23S rRNA pseudouridine955/2504/2580 synthase/23S rRNA pseudouridine1911/1915/1917 synthase
MNQLLKQVNIIYQDDHLIVLDKPSGLLTLPDRFNAKLPNLLTELKRTFDPLFVVHRLDKDTSGIMVFARDAATHAALSQQFEAHEVEKVYHALVSGKLTPLTGTIERGIIPHPSGDGRMTTANAGKKSTTHYEVEMTFRQYSWVKVTIETGRTHQIRVHFAWLQHPLAVDPLYGKSEGILLSSFKSSYRPSKNKMEQPLISRVPLHASQLTFTHPVTGEKVTFTSELPKDLRAVTQQLQRWGI